MNWKSVAFQLIRYIVKRDKCGASDVLRRAGFTESMPIIDEYLIDLKIRKFHKQRRMFIMHPTIGVMLGLYQSELSHQEWMERRKITWTGIADCWPRGFYWPETKTIYFYSGEKADEYERVEEWFFKMLPELADALAINRFYLCGGMKPSNPGTLWPAVKEYGEFNEVPV